MIYPSPLVPWYVVFLHVLVILVANRGPSEVTVRFCVIRNTCFTCPGQLILEFLGV